MLIELNIKNLAIIEEQTIGFGAGLNVISGQTGAGKSIVLQAMELILGARPKVDLIRKGSQGWEIQAHFELSKLSPKIKQELPSIAQQDELVLSRTFSSTSKSRVYVNGQLASVSMLEQIASRLINICSQGQHIRLLEPKYHLEVVDDFAGSQPLLERYEQCFVRWKALSSQLEELEQRLKNAALRQAELEFIVEELGGLGLHPDLRAELESECKKIANSEALQAAGAEALELLNGGATSPDFIGINALLGKLAGSVEVLAKLDPSNARLAELLNPVHVGLQEFEDRLRKYLDSSEVEQELLDKLRDRLAEVARVERKYRSDCAGLIELLARTESELKDLRFTNTDQLRAERDETFKEVAFIAEQLTERRRTSAQRLTKTVEKELAELSMLGAKLDVSLTEVEYTLTGKDQLELMIAPNKGEGLKPLKQIASGGELSRIMLVLKKVLKERVGLNILVFDEVDTGVSGSVARAVGEKLKELSQSSQVICITHLAQVASLADHHFLVEKLTGARTQTVVRELIETQKVDEIARMLAGYTITPAARESARELLSSKERRIP